MAKLFIIGSTQLDTQKIDSLLENDYTYEFNVRENQFELQEEEDLLDELEEQITKLFSESNLNFRIESEI